MISEALLFKSLSVMAMLYVMLCLIVGLFSGSRIWHYMAIASCFLALAMMAVS